MDTRTALEKNNHLTFPGLECVIDASCGRGASVLSYTGYYEDRQDPGIHHRVLIRELFPYDPSGGIFRSENGDLIIQKESEALFREYKSAYLRSNEIHSYMAEEMPAEFDFYINTYSYRNTLYSVLGYTGGRTLQQEMEGECEKYPDRPGSPGREAPDDKSAGRETPFDKNADQKLLRMIRIVRGSLEPHTDRRQSACPIL